MPNKRNFHVVPHDDGWAVRREGAERARSVHSTQADAIRDARDAAIAEQGEVLIHGENGQIRERNSYGNDPFPPPG